MILRFPVFDGHNDLLLRLWQKSSAGAVSDFIDGEAAGHLDLPRMADGGFAGGLFAIYTPSEAADLGPDPLNPFDYPPVPTEVAARATMEMATLLFALERDVPNNGFHICRSVADIRAAMALGAIAGVMHIEGAEAVGPKLEGLEALCNMGLRSLGPVWSRANAFGHGVPFRFPCSPDTGPGLTDAGKALVRECNRLRIMMDVSHLNEKGFWDLAELSDAPIVASHSNVHAICPSSRNLMDDQLRAIGESGGMVGLNFAVLFLREDGAFDASMKPELMIRHLDHMIKLAGEDCVGFGSDFDGAGVPEFLRDASGLPHLVEAMDQAGYGADLIRKITSENW
ncbi:MAG: dipeptidase, partial [Alphaproteobacteria bacterium]|nr:dipeptidase [Alphaproteobacteria bacterium]